MPLYHRRLFCIIMLVHFVLSVWYTSYQGFNPDESDYWSYAIHWAQGHPERIKSIDDSKTPLVFPSLLPIIIKPFYQQPGDLYGFFYMRLGRVCMYAYQFLGAFILFLWLYRLGGGSRGWIIPLILYLLDPLIFSYGMMIGTDLASASILLLTCYSAWRYTQTSEKKYWYWLIAGCCLAFTVKQSLVFIILVLVAALAANAWWKKKYRQPHFFRVILSRWLLLIAGVLLFINVLHYFHKTCLPLKAMPEKSQAFRNLKQNFNVVSGVPVPLPFDYVSGFDLLLYNSEKGGGPEDENSFIGVVILGKYFVKGPVWYYYFVNFYYKTPLLIILLMITSVALFVKHKNKASALLNNIFIWWPPLFFFVMLSLNNPFQIGIRHAILILPFIYLGISKAITWWANKYSKIWIVLLALHLISVGRYWPNFIAYTNELLYPKRLVYKYFYDSSISYRAERQSLDKFLKDHPDYSLPPIKPAAGKYAIDIERMALPLVDTAYDLRWLHKNFEPYDHYRHSILLYNITEDDLRAKGLLK